ncbi:hypothetical protein MYP_3299 [Sporocytophaga myxococcoides]|uniref:Uncharacterized protein n=1 Tax=Sporocytophaga myxococcoides TaxID=153721 RepID=A0A098LGH8_9BACT|nr:hypothetical protein [Sporocytophaga myxococcoides]GAL86070.1 hypothetical protein MYP_3299 [Sporocytophaga myxococcoides]
MYIDKEKALELLSDISHNLKSDLIIKTDFLLSLLEEDDWSLVIKSHALIESIITELIVVKVNEIKLKSFIERLPLHGDQSNKIKIIKAYDLVPDSQIRFIKMLSEIRNNIVHKVENIDFDFMNHLNNLDKNQKKQWKDSLNSCMMTKDVENKMNEFSLNNPRIAVWFSLFVFVSEAMIKISEMKGLKEIDNESEKFASGILKDIFE